MTTPETDRAVADLVRERRRQVDHEGFDAVHDAAHANGELAIAAACYLLDSLGNQFSNLSRLARGLWPFDAPWWKPRSRRENLVRAGALVIAEIERLDREAANAGS